MAQRRGKKSGAPKAEAAPDNAGPRPTPLPKMGESKNLTPLDWMLRVLRDESADPDLRDDAAKTAAPYIHTRLSTGEPGGDGVTLADILRAMAADADST